MDQVEGIGLPADILVRMENVLNESTPVPA
jgi:hypothetical protein